MQKRQNVQFWLKHNNAGTSTLDPRYWRTTGSNGWIANTTYRSYWPHNDIYDSPFGWQTTLSTLWTENDALYHFVCFDTRDVTTDNGRERIYYEVACGKEKQSHFCLSRAGFLQVNNYSIDYGDSLVYNLGYLDPRYDFVAKVAAVHGGTTAWDARLVLDGQSFGTIRVPAAKLESLIIKLPQAAYAKDRAIRLVVKKESGSYASCQSIRLVRYERPRKGHSGGGQSASSSPMNSRISMELHPTLVKDRATLCFQLPASAGVYLTLHDISGRRVKDIYRGRLTSGNHILNLDTDGLPNGVYFLQLVTDEQRQTKKLLLVR